jgi:hypothetical protein
MFGMVFSFVIVVTVMSYHEKDTLRVKLWHDIFVIVVIPFGLVFGFVNVVTVMSCQEKDTLPEGLWDQWFSRETQFN